VQRIWRAHGLKPHLVKTFKVSRDKNFAAKVEDVVGLYLNPPDKALVLCVDEKSQIQALDRTQPGLPMKKGRAGRPCGISTSPKRFGAGPARARQTDDAVLASSRRLSGSAGDCGTVRSSGLLI
jgi:hypothetical protein